MSGGKHYTEQALTMEMLDSKIDKLRFDLKSGMYGGGDPLITQYTGTFSYDETSAAEQIMKAVTIVSRVKVGSIWVDMANVTQNTSIRVYQKIDATNYREIAVHYWLTTDSDGVLLEGFMAYRDFKITLQCTGAGSGSVNVKYAIV